MYVFPIPYTVPCPLLSFHTFSPSPLLPLHTIPPLTNRPMREEESNTNTSSQLGFPQLPPNPPTTEELQADQKTLQELHTLLFETQISEGALVCGNCGHEYQIKEGIANFLLPNHLV